MPIYEDAPLAKVFPLHMDNRFHPISNIDGEEGGRMIVILLPLFIVNVSPMSSRQHFVS